LFDRGVGMVGFDAFKELAYGGIGRSVAQGVALGDVDFAGTSGHGGVGDGLDHGLEHALVGQDNGGVSLLVGGQMLLEPLGDVTGLGIVGSGGNEVDAGNAGKVVELRGIERAGKAGQVFAESAADVDG